MIKSNFFMLFLLYFSLLNANQKHYYCTAADERHFVLLTNLVGSIHKIDFDNLGQVAVFDLGFTQKQLEYLKTVQRLRVYQPEMVHPDLCKPFLTSSRGRKVRGWFAWKPVIIKQALDMFPSLLYLDAGTTVLKSPKKLFDFINEHGYFLIDTGPHSIEERATKTFIQKKIDPLPKEQKDFLLDPGTRMISPGLQGLSRKVYKNYVMPVYECAKDLSLFADDGTCRLGFGAARHDQPVFSLYVYLNKMKIHQEGWNELSIGGEKENIHTHWDRRKLNKDTMIYQSRWHYWHDGDKKKYIMFLN